MFEGAIRRVFPARLDKRLDQLADITSRDLIYGSPAPRYYGAIYEGKPRLL